jgi:hypothetical protein
MGERVAIVGSRGYRDLERVRKYVRSLPKSTVVVTRDVDGVDKAAREEAKANGMHICVHYPDLEQGRAANFKRNRRMTFDSDRLVAFWDTESKSTWHLVKAFEELGLEITVFPDVA